MYMYVGFLGLSTERDNVKIFNVNTCLYMAKGIVDYIAIWDVDEYFIPKPPHHSIMDVIRSADSYTALTHVTGDPFQLGPVWKGGKGWADGDAHPLCYLMLSSEVLYRPPGIVDEGDPSAPWVGDRFVRRTEIQKTGLGFKKSILPTSKIFQGALHMAGGCKLDFPFSGCEKDHNGFCYSTLPRHRYGLTIEWMDNGTQRLVDFSLDQRFDGLILDKDAKKIDMESQAVIYHFQVHRKHFSSTAPVNSTNDYVSRFFPAVVQGMRDRMLELFIIIDNHKLPSPAADHVLEWHSFANVYSMVAAGLL
jgi:hypothetical protein